MHLVRPKIFVIAETFMTDTDSINGMLEAIGMTEEKARGWTSENIGEGNGEDLIEIAGRLCYKSFEPGLNPNVSKIREGNKIYLANILRSKHGSVLEHSSTSIAFIGVTRVFTHEIVRHRAGCSFSQESLRFVRLDDLGFRMPGIIDNEDFLRKLYDSRDSSDMYRQKMTFEQFKVDMVEEIGRVMEEAVTDSQNHISQLLNDVFEIDKIKSFSLKKILTSMSRRIAPIGLATNILITANHRAWRHIIEMRTTEHTEEEPREVMRMVAQEMKQRYPNLYQDMTENSNGEYVFENSKV